jgi:hypothetical protein
MPSWQELKDYARSKYVLDDDNDDGFSLVFEFDNNRTQKIGISHFTAFDKDWIEFRSYVCKEAQMDLKVALRKNEDFAIGALALDEDGDYWLVDSVPLDRMDPEEFELPLLVL